MPVPMTPEELMEIEQIRQLKYRYVRCLDLKQWDELATCFTDDATASYSGGAHSFDGRDAILGFLRTAMGATTMVTSHKVHQPEITLTGDDSATGVWALDDLVIEQAANVTIRGASFYEDRYRKVDGRWQIAHTGYRRVFEEIEPRSPDVTITAHWWDTDGRSSLG